MVYGLLLTFRGDGYQVRLMRLPNRTKLHVVCTRAITVPWYVARLAGRLESPLPRGASKNHANTAP